MASIKLLWRLAIGGWLCAGCAAGPVLGPVPRGLDLYMPVPDGNRLTARKIALGERLFHDRRLSADGSIACATCHAPDRAFSQARAIAIGIHGRRGTRNAPALVNRAWGQSFFWDGRQPTLEAQVLQPIEDPNEMGSTAAAAAARVGLSPREVAEALASFLRSIRSADSPFDRYEAGDRGALDAEATLGLAVFRGKGGCSMCHTAPLFTDERFHNTGVAWQSDTGGGSGRLLDDGRAVVTGRARDRGAFKTPTLREVARTSPYMHDGSLETLEDVVTFYDRGGRPNPQIDPVIRPLGLSADERRGLAAFLRALSGTHATPPRRASIEAATGDPRSVSVRDQPARPARGGAGRAGKVASTSTRSLSQSGSFSDRPADSWSTRAAAQQPRSRTLSPWSSPGRRCFSP